MLTTKSNDAYFPEEYSCQILSRSDLKQWSLRLFWRGPTNKNKKNELSSNKTSTADLKKI